MEPDIQTPEDDVEFVELPDFRQDDQSISEPFIALIHDIIAIGDQEALKTCVEDLHEADMADLIEVLNRDERPQFVNLLGDTFHFNILTELDETIREEILAALPESSIARGLRDMETDDAVFILEDLSKDEQDEVLSQIPIVEQVALRRSLDYPEDSAGRRMQSNLIAVPPHWTVGDSIDYMRDTPGLPEQFYELFVVGPTYKLLGTMPLSILLRAKRPTPVEELMDENVRSINGMLDVEEAARVFERYNLVSAPIVDDNSRLVGVLTVDDVVDVIEEEADADIKALGGVNADEELSDSVFEITRSRFIWLSINLATAFLAAGVLGLFQAQLQQMVALAILAPIVASQGGNAGTQTMTVSVRALATKQLSAFNALRVILRETFVGMINGVGFAFITGLGAYLWFGTLDIGIVIAIAMVVNLTAAAIAGICIPIALDKLKFDPAVSSAVFVTTITDVVGFFTFLGVASLYFGLH